MCLRYSSRVVAPTARSSPRASIGFSRLAASTAPSAAPAPTIVCSSSMNRITVPSASATSFRTALSRSSNSPRYFAPAISAPMSSAITRRSRRPSGTSPETIRWASPSTIAVLPTPGSPISTGLFFVRRERTWITRRISSSRPITGSSLPSCAAFVRSRPNFSSAWYLSSGFWSVTRCGPRTDCTASSSCSRVAPVSTFGSRRERQEQVLGGDVLVGHGARLVLGALQQRGHVAGEAGAALGRAGDLRELVERLVGAAADALGVGVRALEHGHDDAAVLLEQRDEDVIRRDLRVAACARNPAARRRTPPGTCSSVGLNA